MNDQAQYRLGLLLVTAAAVVWSTAGLFTRLSSVDTPTMLFWRGLFGSMAFLIVVGVQERANTVRRMKQMGWHSVFYAVLGAISMQLYISSFRFTSVAHVAVIYAIVPFATGGLGWLFLRERPSRTAMLSSLFAMAGVAVMVGGGAGEGHASGDVLALLMTFGMAGLMVMARKYPDIDLLPAACLSTLMSACISLPFTSAAIPSAYELAVLASFGILSMAVGFVLFAYGSRMLPAAETALIGALDAPLAPIWVWIFFNEIPETATLIGGGIVFGAVMTHFYLQLARNSRNQTIHA